MLLSVQAQAFRCFDDTGAVELRPLNILIGGNHSAGFAPRVV